MYFCLFVADDHDVFRLPAEPIPREFEARVDTSQGSACAWEFPSTQNYPSNSWNRTRLVLLLSWWAWGPRSSCLLGPWMPARCRGCLALRNGWWIAIRQADSHRHPSPHSSILREEWPLFPHLGGLRAAIGWGIGSAGRDNLGRAEDCCFRKSKYCAFRDVLHSKDPFAFKRTFFNLNRKQIRHITIYKLKRLLMD